LPTHFHASCEVIDEMAGALMNCPNCQHDNRLGAKFCEECATPLARSCTNCGHQVSPTAKFCPECAHPTNVSATLKVSHVASTKPDTPRPFAEKTSVAKTALEGERRQLTVLFCDLVGFTELANRLDPEVLQGIIRSYEDACAVCIARYDGYVFQRLGDGIVAFFGYPLAHEGEAERAIHAGLSIIELLSKLDVPEAGRLQVRIGIATGLVVVSSAEKGAVGETMNLASRLQGIAEPGSIVVSQRVQRLAGGTFDYEDLGKQTLKGVGQPTRAYRMVGVSDATSRFEAATQEGLTPLVGREQELGLLMERWALAQDGEGQVVLLSGEPGIGKSRILSALRERLEAHGAQPLRFQCSPYYVNSAFWPSVDNFERALKFNRGETPEAKLDKLEALVVERYGRPRKDVRFIASMLSIPCEERYGAPTMTPQKHKAETLRTLVDLSEAAARKQPSVMLFEDVHWADPTSLEVLDLLIDRVRSMPLLIVLTHRPEFQSRWSQYGHVIGLNLSKLTRTQSSAIVSKLAGGKMLPSELVEQILAKTDGVPLFIEELTKSILESGALKDVGDRYGYVGADHRVTIPATLRDSLMARLDRFMPVKGIAQIGATIGREFSYELIAAVAPLPQAEVDDALAQLTESGLAFRRGTPPEATYTFKHALVQDAAYDSLLKSRRQELHGRIARVIQERFPAIAEAQPELLAHHLTECGRLEEAAKAWERAGDHAVSLPAFVEGVAHFQRGLEILESLPASAARARQQLDIHLKLGGPLTATRGYSAPEVLELYTRSRALCEQSGETAALFDVFDGLRTYHYVNADLAIARDLAYQLLAIAESTNDGTQLLRAHAALGITMTSLGEVVTAREHLERALSFHYPERHIKLMTASGADPGIIAHVYLALRLYALGYPDQGFAAVQRTFALAQAQPHSLNMAWALQTMVWQYLERGAFAEALAAAEAMIALSREQGFSQFLAHGMIFRAAAANWLEEPGKAIPLLKDALAARIAMGSRVGHASFSLLLVSACLRAGEVETGLAVVAEMLTYVERTGDRDKEALLWLGRGQLLLAGDKHDENEAELSLQKAVAVARHQCTKLHELAAATVLAQLWQQQGKREAARELLEPIYAWFNEGFELPVLREARTLLKELSKP
jgi:class 3 adenylate cyclase/tetratricopeptide (TPR) repeat protein